MNKKFTVSLLALSTIWSLETNPAKALSVNLYNGSGKPEDQGWLDRGAIQSSGVPLLPIPTGTDDPNGIFIDTRIENESSGNGYFGYSNYNPAVSLSSPINSAFPTLDRNEGYSIFFNVKVNPIVDTGSNNRAAFSVIAISSDRKGIDIGFDIDNEIFAQNDGVTDGALVGFTSGETTTFNIGTNINNYELRVKDDEYQLFANNNSTPILSAMLRDYDYDEANSNPPLTFDPYETPNFLFFGDSTDQASGTFTLGAVSVSTSSVPFNFSPTLGLAISGIGILLRKLYIPKKSIK